MTFAHKMRISALTVALLVASALMPLTTASADDAAAAVAVVGTAHLSDGIGSSNDEPGEFAGVGAGVGANPTVAGPTVTADFTYNNPTTIAGDAEGTIDISALEVGDAHSVDFFWERTGAVALIEWTSGEGGSGVAAFAPVDVAVFESGHPSWTNDEHAQVVGVGVITN